MKNRITFLSLLAKTLALGITGSALGGTTNQVPSMEQGSNAPYFYVDGEVLCPQRLQWTNGVTLTSAIRRAGGFTGWADQTRIELRLGISTKVCSFAEAASKAAKDPQLQPGTKVHVPRSPVRQRINAAARQIAPTTDFPAPGWSDSSIRVEGEVLHAGRWHWTNGMRLSVAIEMAGGLTPAADANQLRVHHLNEGVDMASYVEATNSTAADRFLSRGDRIIVPRKQTNN
jgi:protein involved in polysaccharide export with SLBB domain